MEGAITTIVFSSVESTREKKKQKEQFVDLKCKFYAVDFRLKLTRNFLEKFDHKSR